MAPHDSERVDGMWLVCLVVGIVALVLLGVWLELHVGCLDPL